MSGLIQLLSSHGIPQVLIIKGAFYSIAALVCLFAILVVASPNIFHSAIYLAAVLIGVACVYLFLDAEFLAVVQVLIYVGAILTLLIFAIMLTSDIRSKTPRQTLRRLLISASAALAALYAFINIIHKNPWRSVVMPPATAFSLAQLGKSLMLNYILPFEVISLVVLAALVGAIAIAKTERR